MAGVDGGKAPPTLSERYLLKDPDTNIKPVEVSNVETSMDASDDVTASEKAQDAHAPSGEQNTGDTAPASVEESPDVTPDAAGENSEVTAAAINDEENTTAAEESSESNGQEESGDQEGEETTEIKLETAPVDYRFPTTNQTRHCFTRYIEYHRCIAAKGEGATECNKFAKYYHSLCPDEWVERWDEQRENGTFPGPL